MIPLSQKPTAAVQYPFCRGILRFAWRSAFLVICGVLVYFWLAKASPGASTVRVFQGQGVIQEINSAAKQVVISHDAIDSYMGAMTMPFNVRQTALLEGLQAGDRVAFRLSVTENESWIDHIVRLASGGSVQKVSTRQAEKNQPVTQTNHPLLSYAFTNELGQPVTLASFKGQALAIAFFFTRCPVPDFCPRLSRNFAEASRQLSQRTGGPTNWHFLSVTFDPDFDTPAVLKAYAQTYSYDASHWSFITGPKDKIAELARLSNVQYEPESGLFNHNFRTLIIDAAGRLQMVFPVGGNLSKDIVSEMLKAAAADGDKQS